MFRLIWRLIKFLVTVVILIALIPAAGLSYGFLTTDPVDTTPLVTTSAERPDPTLRQEVISSIPDYQRPEESTFLTYPEWSIVYAAREYAEHMKDNRESSFPFWAYIGRYWKDYAIMIRATNPYPFNTANHVMLVVIGTSHTIEFGIQSIYENTVGRFTEFISGKPVGEDRYQAQVAAEYAKFLDQTPWYRFDNKTKRRGLWDVEVEKGIAGFRSWERKIAFGISYSVKQVYAWIIRKGLAASSEPAKLDIHVWAMGPVGAAIRGEEETGILRQFSQNSAVFVTPRYQVFTDLVPVFISKGMRFIEIGGNDEVMITFLSPEALSQPENARVLFSYPLPAQPETWRTGILFAVADLHTAIPALQAEGAKLEHLYDY